MTDKTKENLKVVAIIALLILGSAEPSPGYTDQRYQQYPNLYQFQNRDRELSLQSYFILQQIQQEQHRRYQEEQRMRRNEAAERQMQILQDAFHR